MFMFRPRNIQLAMSLVVAESFVAKAAPHGENGADASNLSAVSPLDCDAYLSPRGRVVQGAPRDSTGNSHDSGNEPNDDADATGYVTQPPSVAPSMAPPCSDPLSNARGQYTSTIAPCIVKFHGVSNHQREGQEKEDDLIDYRTSSLCHDSNIVVEIKEYLTDWPDECVGDFARCYSLQHHFDLLCDFLCEGQLPDQPGGVLQTHKPRWELPPGTTHVSVECTIDKDLLLQASTAESKEHHKEVQEARRQDVEGKLLNLVMVLLASVAIIVALSKLIVAPLVSVATAKRDSRRRRRSRSPSSCRRPRSGRRRGSFVTATTRSGSTTSGSSGSGDSSSLPIHRLPQEHLVLLAHAEGIDGAAYAMEQTSPIDGSNDGDYDEDYRSSDDGSSSSGDSRRGFSTSDEDFDAQIPADFDAVPIVPATILPAVTLHATVVQDGISYA